MDKNLEDALCYKDLLSKKVCEQDDTSPNTAVPDDVQNLMNKYAEMKNKMNELEKYEKVKKFAEKSEKLRKTMKLEKYKRITAMKKEND